MVNETKGNLADMVLATMTVDVLKVLSDNKPYRIDDVAIKVVENNPTAQKFNITPVNYAALCLGRLVNEGLVTIDEKKEVIKITSDGIKFLAAAKLYEEKQPTLKEILDRLRTQ